MLRRQRFKNAGMTIVELMICLAILILLNALLIPAIQAAREAARRSSCQNNLKQIGTALLEYESSFGTLPIGARHSLTNGFPAITAGTSWWLDLLPHLELARLHTNLDKVGANSGSVLVHPANGTLIDGVFLPMGFCPSSALAPFERVSQFHVMLPSYVGIAGAANGPSFNEYRVNRCCTPRLDGELSAGGLLISNRAVALRSITDGLSNTMIVGECSASLADLNGNLLRVDGGYRSGWLLGTTVAGTPPDYQVPYPSWNITTLRYSLNEQRYPLPGVYSDGGPNNPLLSSHAGGVNLLFSDGATIFAVEEVDLVVLKNLATRDDDALGNIRSE